MRLIDADKLELDAEWDDHYDGFMSYSQSQIRAAPTVVPEELVLYRDLANSVMKKRTSRGLVATIILLEIIASRFDKKKSYTEESQSYLADEVIAEAIKETYTPYIRRAMRDLERLCEISWGTYPEEETE